MLSLCRRAAVSLSFSWDTQKSRKGVDLLPAWLRNVPNKNLTQKAEWKEQWLPFLAEMLRKGRGKMLHLWKTKCCLARLTTMVLNKMPGFWSCFVFFDTRAVSPKQNTNHYREFITWPLHVVLSTVLGSSSILPSQRMHCLGILPSESFFSMI